MEQIKNISLSSIILKGKEKNSRGDDVIRIGNKLFITKFEDVLNLLFIFKNKVLSIYKRKNLIYKILKFKNLLTKIEELNFSKRKLTVPELNFLKNFDFSQLRILNLQNNLTSFSDFFENFKFPNLESLNLSGNRLNETSFYHLSNSNFRNLRNLDLSGNKIHQSWFDILIHGNGEIFEKLEYLNLSFTKLDYFTNFIKFLCLEIKTIKHLNLSGNLLQEEDFTNISKNSLNNLISFDLKNIKINRKNIKILADGNFENIQRLNLTSCNVDGNILTILAESKNFQRLSELDLSSNTIFNFNLEVLSRMSNLQKIRLSENNIMDSGARNFANAKLRNLEELDLSFNFITREGLKTLLNEYSQRLAKFNISYNYLAHDGIRDAIIWDFEILEFLDVSHNQTTREEALDIIKDIVIGGTLDVANENYPEKVIIGEKNYCNPLIIKKKNIKYSRKMIVRY